MNLSLLIVFTILCGAGLLFLTGWIRNDIVGILVMAALMVSGVLTVPESLAGFSAPPVMIIACMFIISATSVAA